MRYQSILFIAIAALALTVTSASAQTDMGFKGVGAQVGVVNPEDISSTWGLGVLADLGTITPQIGLEAHLDFWTKSDSEFGFDTSIRDIAAGARARYFIPVKSVKVQPYAGAGLAMHFLHASVEIPDIVNGGTMTADDSDTKLGLDIGGGMSARMNDRTDFIGELWFGLVSDVSQVSARVGVVYKLGM